MNRRQMRKIYKQVAKENGVTPEEVERDIRLAINHAYENPPDDGITRARQNQVPRKGAVPTPEEFITFAAEKIKKDIH